MDELNAGIGASVCLKLELAMYLYMNFESTVFSQSCYASEYDTAAFNLAETEESLLAL